MFCQKWQQKSRLIDEQDVATVMEIAEVIKEGQER